MRCAGSTATTSWSTSRVWRGTRAGRPFGLEGSDRPLEFRLLHVIEFADDGEIQRENVWIDLAAIIAAAAAGLTWRAGETGGRPNQKRRTRKDLLQAAARLMKQGRKPDLEEIAEEALVSRATAYRYFPGVEALLVEAALDVAVPEPHEVLRDAPADDPVARLRAGRRARCTT